MAEEATLKIDRKGLENLLAQVYGQNAELIGLLDRLSQKPAPNDGMTCILLGYFMNHRGDPQRAEAYMKRAFTQDSALLRKLLPPENPNAESLIQAEYQTVKFESCPVCASRERTSLFAATPVGHVCYHAGLCPWLHWVQCRECTHVYPKEQNPPDALFGGPPRATGHSTDLSRERYERDSRSVAHLAQLKPRGRVFEIGPGNGTRMQALADMGMTVRGIEIQETIANRCRQRGLDVVQGDFTTHVPPAGEAPYDVIVMGDVIEHLPNLRPSVAKLPELLTSDGFLWVSTPIFEHPELEKRRVMGADPYFLEIEHWHYFTQKSLLKLLEECGFHLSEQRMGETFIGAVEFTFRRG